MAKGKTRKTAAKIKSASKPKAKRAPTTMSNYAAHIFAECSFATGQGMERWMIGNAGGRPYTLDPAARDWWLARHTLTIPLGEKKHPNGWVGDRVNAIRRAIDLGIVAAQNALADVANSGKPSVNVSLQNAQDASATVSADPRCRAAKRTKGAGVYCVE